MRNIHGILIGVFFLFALCLDGKSQDTEYLIPLNTNFTFNGYGSVEFKRGNLVDEGASFLGLKGGAVINNKIGFGITAGAFLSENNFSSLGTSVEMTQLTPAMGYGGVFIEYIGLSSKKIHFSVPITMGPGVIALFEQTEVTSNVEDEDLVEFSPFFVLEPGANLEINLLKEVKLCIGGSYRLVAASGLDRLNDSDLSDFMFNIGIKIGSY